MSTSKKSGFFTGLAPSNYKLPHPRLGLPVILLIRSVLRRAFEILRIQEDFDLENASENKITAALRGIVENNLRQTGVVAGFNRNTYEFVGRQGQWSNYSGESLEKEPDLFFKLRHDDSTQRAVISEFDGLFVEAKPVDVNHSAGRKYCDDGLIRFVNGNYAWAMQEGAMPAYSRDGRTIEEHLLPAMS